MPATPSAPTRGALPAVRRQYALHVLGRRGSVTCQDLRALFDISDATARRDIAVLVRRGQAVRVYGGAILPDGVRTAGPRPWQQVLTEPR